MVIMIKSQNKKIAKSASISKNCEINVNELVIGEGTIIEDNVKIIAEKLVLGAESTICSNAQLIGRNITAGDFFYVGNYATIGGGSCMEKKACFEAGKHCHLGGRAFINIARKVTLGNEVGLGAETKLYTHGAYLSFLDGFPVKFAEIKIGSRVWIPQATVLPGVTIEDDVVVGAGSLVTRDIPAGSLALGVPARVVKKKEFPKKYSYEKKTRLIRGFLAEFREIAEDRLKERLIIREEKNAFEVGSILVSLNGKGEKGTKFDLKSKKITGKKTQLSEILRNEFRRYGVRFDSKFGKESYG